MKSRASRRKHVKERHARAAVTEQSLDPVTCSASAARASSSYFRPHSFHENGCPPTDIAALTASTSGRFIWRLLAVLEPPTKDSLCTGTTLRYYLRRPDLVKLPTTWSSFYDDRHLYGGRYCIRDR